MIRLSKQNPDLVLGYLDEVWWSRFAQPRLHAWSDGEPLPMMQRAKAKIDHEPQAIACYGLLRKDTEAVRVRFLKERPVSAMTIEFLRWIMDY
ncbi:MAG: hypothetical protein ACR2N3_00510 [Pyrinomonadaceae bacterium]